MKIILILALILVIVGVIIAIKEFIKDSHPYDPKGLDEFFENHHPIVGGGQFFVAKPKRKKITIRRYVKKM